MCDAHHGGEESAVRAAEDDDAAAVEQCAALREAADDGGVVAQDVVQGERGHHSAVRVFRHVVRPRRAKEPVLRGYDATGIQLLRKLQQRRARHGVRAGCVLRAGIKQDGVAGAVRAEAVVLHALAKGGGGGV